MGFGGGVGHITLKKGYALQLVRFQFIRVADAPGALGPEHAPFVFMRIVANYGHVLENWSPIQQLSAVVERQVLAVQAIMVVLPA